MRTQLLRILVLQVAVTLCGCSVFQKKPEPGYATVNADPCRDEKTAIEQTTRASELLAKGKSSAAEEALRQALIADVTYAPAHNNLGALYFEKGKLYLAAWEFEYARKLMPDSARAYNNLGLVYEQADRLDQAIEYFESAHRMESRNPEFIGNLARAYLSRDDRAPEAGALLSDLILYDARPEWVAWAREQLAVGNLPATPVSSPGSRPRIDPPVEILPPSVTIPQPVASRREASHTDVDTPQRPRGQGGSTVPSFSDAK